MSIHSHYSIPPMSFPLGHMSGGIPPLQMASMGAPFPFQPPPPPLNIPQDAGNKDTAAMNPLVYHHTPFNPDRAQPNPKEQDLLESLLGNQVPAGPQ